MFWHRHTSIENRTERQKLGYKDTCQVDWIIANNGWYTKYNLVSIWGCENAILKNVLFEKKFMPFPHFIVCDFETKLALLNETPQPI